MAGFVGGWGVVTKDCRRLASCRRTGGVRMMSEDVKPSPDAEFKGFGEAPKKPVKKEKSKYQKEQDAAGRKLDEMRKAGMPEYTIWLRTEGEEQWFPVGSMSVDRSSKIESAIYENEEALWKGARRQYPKLQGLEEQTEIGYKLADFPDEEVRIAKRPSDEDNGILKNFFDKLLNPLNTGKN